MHYLKLRACGNTSHVMHSIAYPSSQLRYTFRTLSPSSPQEKETVIYIPPVVQRRGKRFAMLTKAGMWLHLVPFSLFQVNWKQLYCILESPNPQHATVWHLQWVHSLMAHQPHSQTAMHDTGSVTTSFQTAMTQAVSQPHSQTAMTQAVA